MTTVRERIEGLDDDPEFGEPVVLSARERKVVAEFKLGNLLPADEVDARIAEAVAGERHRISDWAWEIARQHDKEAKRLGLILNGRQRFAARKFRQFAAAIRGDDHDG